jgi:molybdopterin-guanine dinucleotide biosynthesis protein A
MIPAIILCGGKQSRFESPVPKSLMRKADGKTYLSHNAKILMEFTDKIYVVSSEENNHFFNQEINLIQGNIELVSIKSGGGCGNGVYQVLKKISEKSLHTILLWGDAVILDEDLPELCFEAYNDYFLMPVVYKKNPYVIIQTSDYRISGVKFSKYNEIETGESGYHDQCFFLFNSGYILNFLDTMIKNKARIKKSDRNGETLFLDIFNNFETMAISLKLNDREVISYNTMDEYIASKNYLTHRTGK